jgi:hypothetical protein
MSKRLELIWPNKDKVLLGLEENGKPIWGTKADLELRLLVQLEAIDQLELFLEPVCSRESLLSGDQGTWSPEKWTWQ